jgi:hypothetical protein
MAKIVPFINLKLAGKILVELDGEPVFNSDVNLNLKITENNAAQMIEGLTPQIMELANQVGDLLSKKIAESQAPTNPFESLFGHSRPLHPDEE